MNKIEGLIKKLCPDGVEYKPLQDICLSIKTGKLNANAMVEDGKYPFFTCDETPFRIDNYAFNTEAILISGNGSQVGHINYYCGKFNAYQRTYVLFDFIKEVNVRYLLHYLKGYLKGYILSNSKKGSVPYITLPMLQRFILPVPPMEIQNEIVKTLDNFTELTAELTAELQLRRKQYEFYRDNLLKFENDVMQIQIKEVVKKVENIKWNNTALQYQYIDLSSVDRDNHKIVETTLISKDNAPSRAQQIIKKDDILFGGTRPMLKRSCIVPDEYDNQICSTGYCVLRANDEIILPKYLYYIINTEDFYNYIEKNQEGASYPSISDEKIKQYNLTIPDIKIQRRIVDVLDNFDKICSDLGIGLPAEIDARQKQYEYYREKLLTFDKQVGGGYHLSDIYLIKLLQYVYGFVNVKLEEICSLSAGGDVPKDNFSKNKTEKFNIPIYSNGVKEKALYGYTTDAKITEASVTISARGTIGYCELRDEPYYPIVRLISATPNSFMIPKFLKFILDIQQYEIPKTGIPQLTIPMIKDMLLPLPPLEKQKEIVEILDKFDVIINDISKGLPAEIEARQKQYEYYRERLLNFKRKD